MVKRLLGTTGLETQYSYNPWNTQGGRLLNLTSVVGSLVLQDLEYAYDATGNILNIYDNSATMGTEQTLTFGYDALDRLTSAQALGGNLGAYSQQSYTYSTSTGNLASKAGVGYTYGDTNHKHAVTALSNGNTYAYDANGNMIQRAVGRLTDNLSIFKQIGLPTI